MDPSLRDERAWNDRQRALYERLGVDAFTSGVVPWRISTSVAMAKLVVQVASAFAKDTGRARVKIVELGGGSGRLAFHVSEAAREGDVPVRYVLTDAAQSMLEAWRSHPQLTDRVDLARVSATSADDLRGVLSTTPDEALVVVGTYLLDTLPNRLVPLPAGDDESTFIRAWTKKLGSAGHTLIPTGAFNLVQAIERSARAPTLLLLADKGSLTPASSVERADQLRVAAHEEGASAWVNFPALVSWLGWRGAMLHPRNSESFVVLGSVLHRGSVSATGTREALIISAHPLVVQAEKTALRSLDGLDLCSQLISLPPDADLLLELADQLRAAMPKVGVVMRGQVARWVLEAARAAFFMKSDDAIFHAGTVVQSAGFLELAVACYQESLQRFGPSVAAHFNRAMCLLDLRRQAPAIVALRDVLELDPKHERASQILASLELAPHSEKSKPGLV